MKTNKVQTKQEFTFEFLPLTYYEFKQIFDQTVSSQKYFSLTLFCIRLEWECMKALNNFIAFIFNISNDSKNNLLGGQQFQSINDSICNQRSLPEDIQALVNSQKVRLKLFFSTLANSSLNLPIINQFFAGSKKNQLKEVKEGFKQESSSEDDDDFQIDPLKSNEKRLSIIMKMPPSSNQGTILKQKDEVIAELELKLEQREIQIRQMTEAYKKDISHFKLMFNRKENNQETFDVSYFDALSYLDTDTKQILSEKLAEVSSIHSKRLQDQLQKTKIAEDEVDRLKKMIQSLTSQHTQTQLFQIILQMDNNPYKIWKLIQENIGNKQIFLVFEEQKHQYGINYREIDEILQKSSSSFRIFQSYQKVIDEQMVQLVERTSSYLNQLTSDIAERDNKLINLENKMNLQKTQIVHDLKEQVYNEVSKQVQRVEFSTLRQHILDQQLATLFAKGIKQACIIRWSGIARIFKLAIQAMQIQELDVNDRQIIDRQILNQSIKFLWRHKPIVPEDIQSYITKIQSLEKEIESYRINQIEKNQQLKFANDRIQNLESQLYDSQNFVQSIKNQKRLVEQKNYLLDSCLEKCVQKQDQQNFESNQKILKDFQLKLDEIYVHKSEYIDQVVLQHRKAQQTFIRMFDHWEYKNNGTITDLNNLNYSLSYLEEKEAMKKNLELEESEMKLLLQLLDKKNKNELNDLKNTQSSQMQEQHPEIQKKLINEQQQSQIIDIQNDQNQNEYLEKSQLNQLKIDPIKASEVKENKIQRKEEKQDKQKSISPQKQSITEKKFVKRQQSKQGFEFKFLTTENNSTEAFQKSENNQDITVIMVGKNEQTNKNNNTLHKSTQTSSYQLQMQEKFQLLKNEKINHQYHYLQKLQNAITSIPRQEKRYQELIKIQKKIDLNLSTDFKNLLEDRQYLRSEQKSRQVVNMSIQLDDIDFVTPVNINPKSRADYYFGKQPDPTIKSKTTETELDQFLIQSKKILTSKPMTSKSYKKRGIHFFHKKQNLEIEQGSSIKNFPIRK